MSNVDSRISAPVIMAAALLGLVCNFLFTFNLGDEYIDMESEARVLLTVRQMQREGTLIIPSAPGEDRWTKSPLFIWAVQLSAAFHDEVTPEVARIPGVLSIVALVLLAAWWTRDHNSRYPREDNPDAVGIGLAVLAGLMVATNPDLYETARSGSPDALFTFLVFAALFCFAQSIEIRRSYYADHSWRALVLGGYALIGLATLTKGPLAFLFVLPAYALTCFHYRLRRPDWIHAVGLTAAAVIGFWWYGVALALRPAEWGAFWTEMITKRFGSDASSSRPVYFYLGWAWRDLLPWSLPALYMIGRTLRGGHRTPSRLMWSWAFIVGFAGLSMVTSKRTVYMMPVIPGFILLAADALAHLDFEHWAGKAFRIFIRTARWVIIALGFVVGIGLGSDAALVLAVVMTGIVIALQFHRSRIPYVYARWERTVQGAWMLTLAFMFAEIAYARDIIPRHEFFTRKAAFIQQVRAHMPRDARLHLYGNDSSATFSYYFEKLAPRTRDLESLAAEGDPNSYLVGSEKVDERLLTNPNLALVASRIDPGSGRTRAGLFKVLPARTEGTTRSLAMKYENLPSLKIVLLGNAGADRKGQRDVAGRIEHVNELTPLHQVVLLGDSLWHGSMRSPADFDRAFERPYKDLLQAGLPFNGMIGGLYDEKFAWLLTRYPVYQMGEKRYYSRDFHAGLVRYLALDAGGLLRPEKPGDDARQLAWIKAELARKDETIWKIVGLHPALAGTADPSINEAGLAATLLPVLDEGGADLVVWSGGHWYERIEDPSHKPLMIGAGWSGLSSPPAVPAEDVRRKALSGDKPGFVLIEAAPRSLKITASDEEGTIVDTAEITK